MADDIVLMVLCALVSVGAYFYGRRFGLLGGFGKYWFAFFFVIAWVAQGMYAFTHGDMSADVLPAILVVVIFSIIFSESCKVHLAGLKTQLKKQNEEREERLAAFR